MVNGERAMNTYQVLIERIKNQVCKSRRQRRMWRKLLSKQVSCAINAASSISTSSIITNGLLPPSSSETFFKLESAAALAIMRPTSVDPVNATFRISGCELKANEC